MKDERKTKAQLIEELTDLRQKVDAQELVGKTRIASESTGLKVHPILYTIFNESPSLMAVMDSRFNFSRVSLGFARVHGREQAYYQGKNYFKVYPDNPMKKAFSRVVDSGKPHFESTRPIEIVKHPDGDVLHMDWSVIPFKHPQTGKTRLLLMLENVTEHVRVDELLNKRTHELGERIKELNCLYSISILFEKPDIPLEEILQEVVEILPPAWQYPEITQARILIGDEEYKTRRYRTTASIMTKDIRVLDEEIGAIEVAYLEERPARDEGPFLREERHLIDAIAMQLGRAIAKKRIEKALISSNEALAHSSQMMLALNQAAQSVLRSDTPEEVFRTGLDEVVKLGNQALIFMLEDDRTHLVLTHIVGSGPIKVAEKIVGVSANGLRLPFEPGTPRGQVITEGKTVFVASMVEQFATGIPNIARALAERISKMLGMETGIYTPLVEGGKIIGMLALTGSDLNEDDSSAVIAFANQISIALEKTRLYQETLESEKRFKGLSASALDAILIMDEEANITFWNEAAEKMFGYPRHEAIGKQLQELIARGGDEDASVKGFNGFGPAGEGSMLGKTLEVEAIRADGTEFPIEISLSSVMQKGVMHQIGIIRDITERKRAVEALRQSEAAYRGIFEGVQDAIIVEKMTGEIIDTNTRACEMYGWSRDELLKKTGLDLVAEGHSGIISGNLEGAELPPGPVETLNVRANGEHFPVEISARFHAIGDENVMLIVVRDITERKQAEEQLKSYAAKLEQANEEVRQFAYIVSHDMRAPLVNLKGFASELRNSLAVIWSGLMSILPQFDAELRNNVVAAFEEDVPEALGFIDTAVTRMDHFINALLKLSRIGHRELQFEQIDTEAIIRATLETFAFTIEERQVDVVVGSLPEVIADMTSMEQIMANIIGNAMKYLNPDHPGKIEITAEPGDDEVTFMIHDNGRGIAKEDMHKVFAPFRRIGKQDVPGDGMGLPYAQAMVRKHGGRIWCESELGVGTTFGFTISNQPQKGAEDAENA